MTSPPTTGPVTLHPGKLAHALTLVHTGEVTRRSELTEQLAITRTGAGGILRELEGLRLIRIGPGSADRSATGGRPSPTVAIDAAAPAGLAVQIEPDAVLLADARLGGSLRSVQRISLTDPGNPDQVLSLVLDRVIDRLGVLPLCAGVGVAIPSAVGPGGLALSALPLGWPANVDVGRWLSEQLRAHGRGNVSLIVGNDANLAALAESRHGAGRGAQHMLFLRSWPSGVGGGLVIGGRLHTGSAGYALEVGHITVDPSGPVCHCGNTGCLEMHGTPAALLGLVADPAHPGLDLPAAARQIIDATSANPTAAAAVATVREHLATGLGTLINILNPDRIVLGTLHAELLDADPQALRDAVSRRSYLAHASQIPIVPAQLQQSSLVGAAELALQPLLDNPRLFA